MELLGKQLSLRPKWSYWEHNFLSDPNGVTENNFLSDQMELLGKQLSPRPK
jgi:hypothetical protein